jgi:hypothetical protein
MSSTSPAIERTRSRFFQSGTFLVICLALVKLLIHFVANGRYGCFRDELYYLACAEHLDWGYVDQPPLVALIVWLSRALLGDSLFAIRFFPAVAGAVKVVLAGLMARELGGGRFAQVLAALAVLIAPVYLGTDNFLSMNAFEPVFWMGCAYVLIRTIKTGNQRLWLWFGLLAGLGLENKHSTAFFGFGVFVGLLLTAQRRFFRQKWIWLGGLVALAIFLPNLVWQVRHDWATLELLNNVKNSTKNVTLSPVQFFAQQILMMHPLNFLIWLVGLGFYFFARTGKAFRVLGWTYLVMFIAFVALKGKVYYLAPAYPMLLAAGALVVENWIQRSGQTWLKAAVVSLLILGGAATAPYGLPVLPVETFLRYQNAMGLKSPRTETSHTAELPQLYADQFGWEEMTVAVARVYHSLSPEEQAKTAIFGNNYGEAGAIDFFGTKYGLPKAISAHQNYFFWGPREYTGEIVIVLGGARRNLEQRFEHVEKAAVLFHPYAMPFENGPVYLCRGLKEPLKELWPKLKYWL